MPLNEKCVYIYLKKKIYKINVFLDNEYVFMQNKYFEDHSWSVDSIYQDLQNVQNTIWNPYKLNL